MGGGKPAIAQLVEHLTVEFAEIRLRVREVLGSIPRTALCELGL